MNHAGHSIEVNHADSSLRYPGSRGIDDWLRLRPISAVTADAVYVVNGADSSISVIDAASSSLTGTIQINDAEFPHHIYMSADRSEMFVAVPGMDLSEGHEGTGGAEHEMSWVLRLEAATGAVLTVAMLDEMNHNAIPSPDGQSVWTSQMAEPGSELPTADRGRPEAPECAPPSSPLRVRPANHERLS
jgi:hypothetical protein